MLTTRFNQTEAQAIVLINALPQTEMYSLASEISSQADFIEQSAEALMNDLHLQAAAAMDEIYRIITHKDDIHSYESRDHAAYILRRNLNPEFFQHSVPLHVITKLDAKIAHIKLDGVRETDFENQQVTQRKVPRLKTPEEEAQAVWDYNSQLLITELEIDAEDAKSRMSKIPLEDQNSITHHLQGRTGFVPRFTTYMARIIGQTHFTYEELTKAMFEVASGKRARDASIDISPFLTENEMETVYRFKPWHFNLLSQKICNQFHKLYPQHYVRKENTTVCARAAIPNLPVLSSMPLLDERSALNMSSKVLPHVPTKLSSGTALLYITSITVFGVALLLCTSLFRQRSNQGFFNRNAPKRTQAKTYPNESSLYIRP